MRPLVLWDVDGTLMRGSGMVTALFVRALREIYELPDEIRRIDYGGKTDGQIVLETLALHEIDTSLAHDRLPHFGRRYHELVVQASHELHRGLHLLPGVVETLEALRTRGVIQTLLTGNMEPVAELKLRALDLDRFFDLPIGAYGSDDHDRLKLVPIAQRKAAARYHEPIGPAIVIGDTPRDIACGKAGGARTVAVATGRFSIAELAPYTPGALLPDLRDTDTAVRTILDLVHDS